jgi:hypothetical protein
MSDFLAEKRQKKQRNRSSAPAAQSLSLEAPSQQSIQRAQFDPRQMSPGDVSALQRSAGNRAVARMLGVNSSKGAPAIQRKLQVGPADDQYEREANNMAKMVSRKADDESETIQTSRPAPSVGMEGGTLDSDLEGQLKSAKGGGSPMPKNVKNTLESKMGADLSGVRVHTGSKAASLNASLGAKAFTHGSDIFYGAGQSPHNVQLTAHETTHTIQQGAVKQVRPKRTQEEQ